MSDRGRILIADDKENMRALLERLLGETHEVQSCEDGLKAISLAASGTFDVLLCDIRMPGADGFEVLQAVKAQAPDTEVVLMTAFATVQKAVAALRLGAYDYLAKPFEPEDAQATVARALERRRLKQQTQNLQREVEGRYRLDKLYGKSAAMQRLYDLLERASSLDVTVLIHGESGTGKELAARAIHFTGKRRSASFVPVNCGAIPEQLIESELFGHARGAFTGAAGERRGLFEEASGGTLFLDEIGDLPLSMQVKLNRVLQEGTIRRLGETKERPVDVRIIAASHVDLREASREGKFREDLFYRLNVLPIEMPPLRDRAEDLPLLAAHFLEELAPRFGRTRLPSLSPEALKALLSYSWPGNVREFRNAMERALAITSADVIEVHDIPAEIGSLPRSVPTSTASTELTYREMCELARDRASAEYLTALLRATGGNVTLAASKAGMARESLHRLLKRYSIRSAENREGENDRV